MEECRVAPRIMFVKPSSLANRTLASVNGPRMPRRGFHSTGRCRSCAAEAAAVAKPVTNVRLVTEAPLSYHNIQPMQCGARFDYRCGAIALRKPAKTNSFSVGRTGNDRLNSLEIDGTFSKAWLLVRHSRKENECSSLVVVRRRFWCGARRVLMRLHIGPKNACVKCDPGVFLLRQV